MHWVPKASGRPRSKNASYSTRERSEPKLQIRNETGGATPGVVHERPLSGTGEVGSWHKPDLSRGAGFGEQADALLASPSVRVSCRRRHVPRRPPDTRLAEEARGCGSGSWERSGWPRSRDRSNCQTLFGITRIPSDNHIRDMLDPVAPDHLFPAFGEAVARLERSGGIAAFRRLGSHVLIALDGTEYHRSTTIHCPCCSTRTRKGQPTEFFHTLLCATIVAPGHAQVVLLEPEFIRPQDGHDKQDCESRAVRRWLERHGPRYKRLNPIYLGDDLHACQPVCEAVTDQGGHFLFTCKPASHQTIQEYLTGIELSEHVERVKRGARARHPPLPLAVRCTSARGQGCTQGQLAHGRDPEPPGRGHVPQQLHHRSAGHARERDRACGLRTGALEDRE